MRLLERFRAASLAYPGEWRDYARVDFDDKRGDPGDKMNALRAMIRQGANDPRINELASAIVRRTPARDDAAECAALLSYVQSKVRYTDEEPEIFRSAVYSAIHGYGDCDDGAVLMGALCESIGIPVKLVIISKHAGLWRYEPIHVFCVCGLPKRNPMQWIPAETTMQMPFGWNPIMFAQDHAASL